ncbi:translation initiation factor IF-2-like isoform X2 [Amphibalanus amphitrite]|uniref:translation initiation factor IF-2-like isoform X2 n=1 Tax=Amphibalanus amphitrite TaxID=1232801 RepID=UPI001C8FCF75|nr:translation initiation factor IF-2-like isoform X2 [Amphibalanus amphitrite]
MTRLVGGALLGWLLLTWPAAARAETTVTQQSSSAWGSVENGRPVDRGTHTSHTTDVLPDGDDGGLGVRFGFGTPRQPARPTAQRPAQGPAQGPSQGPTQGPEPGLGAGGQAPAQSDPFQPGVADPSQQPALGSHGGTQQPPVSGVPNAVEEAYRSILAQYPNFHINIGGRYPWAPFGQQPGSQGGFYTPWNTAQGTQTDLGVRGGFGSSSQDPAQQVPGVGGAAGFPAGTAGSGAPSQGAQPVPGATGPAVPGAGTPGLTNPVPVSPGVANPAFGSFGHTNPGLTGAGGAGGSFQAVNRPSYPFIQMPDINSYVNQLTQRALQNIARGMSPSLTPGVGQGQAGVNPSPGASGVQVRHDFSSVSSRPGQPGFQSQQASVNSASFQPSQFSPQARPSPLPSFPPFGGQRLPQQGATDAAWP